MHSKPAKQPPGIYRLVPTSTPSALASSNRRASCSKRQETTSSSNLPLYIFIVLDGTSTPRYELLCTVVKICRPYCARRSCPCRQQRGFVHPAIVVYVYTLRLTACVLLNFVLHKKMFLKTSTLFFIPISRLFLICFHPTFISCTTSYYVRTVCFGLNRLKRPVNNQADFGLLLVSSTNILWSIPV